MPVSHWHFLFFPRASVNNMDIRDIIKPDQTLEANLIMQLVFANFCKATFGTS
jgi:hypothetical protein